MLVTCAQKLVQSATCSTHVGCLRASFVRAGGLLLAWAEQLGGGSAGEGWAITLQDGYPCHRPPTQDVAAECKSGTLWVQANNGRK